MNLNRTRLFIALSSAALLIVLVIQVNWIVQTAKIKEELFNEKANMVLARTSEALSRDTATCRSMEACIGKNEIHKIDSLFRYYMKFYNFPIDYSFEVLRPVSFLSKNVFDNRDSFPKELTDTMAHFPPSEPACYQRNLEQAASNNGFELKLVFPKKEQFIVEEMGAPFIASVILIVVVLVLFWRTVLSLMKEKRISEHTTDFLNNMTHEFKTPLTNIALAGKMIVKDAGLKHEDKIRHYTGIILEENEKLRLQVEQVLSMTALERGEIPLQRTELDFHQLIGDAVKCMSVQIEHKEGSLKLNLEAERSVVLGDRTHLVNAFCNLVDNALKYSREKPELSIQTSNSDSHLVAVVSDKGIGIKEEHQKKVFDKFFRVPTGDVHDVKGFGLGLAYIKKIVELHGGTIGLWSDPHGQEKGTTFTITLPYV